MDQPKRKIQLNEILDKTSTSIALEADGSIVVHHYDFSDEAQQHFGNDVAFIITLTSEGKEMLHTLLSGNTGFRTGDEADLQLLGLIQARFKGYHDFQDYLQANNVPYEKRFDSWA